MRVFVLGTRPATPIMPAHDGTATSLSAMQCVKWVLRGRSAEGLLRRGAAPLRGWSAEGATHLHQPPQNKKPARGGWLMGLLMAPLHPAPFGLRLALAALARPAQVHWTCWSNPSGFSPPSATPKQKTRTRRVLCFGVADGVRTHDNWNHNPGLYR